MREARIEAALVAAVRAAGGLALKLVSPGRAGVPDRLVLWPGGVAEFVELKTATGRVTPLQRAEHAHLRRLGFRVEVIRSAAAARAYAKEDRT